MSYKRATTDVSRGQEVVPFGWVNTMDGAVLPSGFTYVTHVIKPVKPGVNNVTSSTTAATATALVDGSQLESEEAMLGNKFASETVGAVQMRHCTCRPGYDTGGCGDSCCCAAVTGEAPPLADNLKHKLFMAKVKAPARVSIIQT